MRIFFAFLFSTFFTFSEVDAQRSPQFAQVDQKVLALPAQRKVTVAELSNFINTNFKTQPERARAAYVWLAENITYDVKALIAAPAIGKGHSFIDQTLNTRKAVCQGYAEVFQELCTRAGIKTHFVSGYTKQLGKVYYISHAWIAAQIDGQWFMFDPTWGAGYVEGNRFVKKFNEQYFMASSEAMLKTHYPFDPLWQLSASPIKAKEFDSNVVTTAKRITNFKYADTLAAYDKADDYLRLVGTVRRMNDHGLDNPFQIERYKYLQEGIDIERFNAINAYYNQGIDLLNEFVRLRNNRLLPTKKEEEVRKLVGSTISTFQQAKSQFEATRWQTKNKNIALMQTNLEDALKQAQAQEVYLNKFYASAALGKNP